MARKTYNWFTGQTVTQSLGSIIAASLGNSVHPSIASNPNLRLTTFSNNELLELLAKRFPGLSRPITFDPQGLGIGSGVFAQSQGHYADASFVEPDVWDIDGRLQHRFQLPDSAIANGLIPRGIGNGAETIVSQPLKADQRIYFEIHMNKYPKQVDSNGVQTTFNNIGGGTIGGGGSGSVYDWNRFGGNTPAGLGGEIEIAVAPTGWKTSGSFESVIGRMVGFSTKGIFSTNQYQPTGYNPSNQHYASYLNIHPENDSDISEVVDGDIFMIAIDGVQDSTTSNNKFYFGKNGVWAKADSINNLSTLEQGLRNFDPGDDSAIRGGWNLGPSEDPYHIYISPIWDPSAKDSAAGVLAGDYRYMDVDLTIKTGADVTYSAPTSGTGKAFKAH